MTTPRPEHADRQEHEREIAALRAALLPGVPADLQAPPDRMERVRRQVRRTRRLRAAAALVPLLAVAATLLPRPQTGPDRTAVAASSRASVPTPGPSSTRTALESLDGLRLVVPPGWQTLNATAAGEDQGAVRYVANAPLSAGSGLCGVALDGGAAAPHSCLPVSQLHRRQVLVALRLWRTSKTWTTGSPPSRSVSADQPSAICRKLGGTASLYLDLPLPVDGSTTFLIGTACLSEPTAAVRNQALSLLRTAAVSPGP
ncbi:hypothetical protein [Peterkaempfera sp. SMS 1(5)a]|uniref:hypothetical protein n=1 Tax=Peterkaempfera podocarpi TaxID=3232308 RepID=UPI00366CC1D3